MVGWSTNNGGTMAFDFTIKPAKVDVPHITGRDLAEHLQLAVGHDADLNLQEGPIACQSGNQYYVVQAIKFIGHQPILDLVIAEMKKETFV